MSSKGNEWSSKIWKNVRGVSFFFSSRRRHTRFDCDWSSDVCSSDLDVDHPVTRIGLGEPGHRSDGEGHSEYLQLMMIELVAQTRFANLVQPPKLVETEDRKSVV